MIRVFVQINDAEFSADISPALYVFLREGSALRGRPMQEFLRQIIEEYGKLNEENIRIFLWQKWKV